jgi:2-polyprenyl-3-methyl-5-hydroxy-6-metoxy-1,4-benzoquinol methylase
MKDLARLKTEKQRIVDQYGPWTAHNIHLKDDVYTIDKRIVGDELKLKRFMQIIADTVRKPLSELRVLDLACLEGLYAIELARQGAEVVGIEGREANLAKAKFSKEALGLDRLSFYQDDVRNLSVEGYGTFDVVLCLGILYHLPSPDVFAFLERISEVCTNLTIIDTHISLGSWQQRTYKSQTYKGRSFLEHPPTTSREKRLKALWSSLDNTTSFWLTKPSLHNFLLRNGFTSTYECILPSQAKPRRNRTIFMALKGKQIELISSPEANAVSSVEL